MRRTFRLISLAGYLVLFCAVLVAAGAGWLRWDAGRDHREALQARRGELTGATRVELETVPGLAGERVTLVADSGLEVTLRVLRPAKPSAALPVLILLGGHRTGSDAVALFDEIGQRAIVALDYPYDGPHRTDGGFATARALPAVRQAFYDAAPSIWLTVDWLSGRPWVDTDRLVMAGISLGVPFAATAAARDERIGALMLVHGAADNRAWIAQNLKRKADFGFLHPAASSVLNWIVYGPMHDTAAHVAAMSPRPVLIVGARDDERVPSGQIEELFAAAHEPKTLRWTDGRHVHPGRREVIDELLQIAAEEL
jgi:dienelactone hydrolase